MATENKDMQQRRDTAANWTSNDPTLKAGEFGGETDTGKLKFGDGATAWSALAYLIEKYNLSELADVTFTSTANDDVVQRKSGVWVNRTVAQLMADASLANMGTRVIDNLSDVDTTTAAPAVGDAMVWDGTNWVPDSGTYQHNRSFIKEGASYYYEPAGTDANGFFGDSMNEGVCFLVPFDLDREVTIDRIAIEVTTVGDTGAVARLGLYDADADGIPTDLIVDGGTVATDGTTGVKEATISATCGPGRIFIAAVGQGSPTTQAQTRQFRASLPGIGRNAVATTGGRSGYQKNSVSGALPDPLGALSSPIALDRAPRLQVRVA